MTDEMREKEIEDVKESNKEDIKENDKEVKNSEDEIPPELYAKYYKDGKLDWDKILNRLEAIDLKMDSISADLRVVSHQLKEANQKLADAEQRRKQIFNHLDSNTQVTSAKLDKISDDLDKAGKEAEKNRQEEKDILDEIKKEKNSFLFWRKNRSKLDSDNKQDSDSRQDLE